MKWLDRYIVKIMTPYLRGYTDTIQELKDDLYDMKTRAKQQGSALNELLKRLDLPNIEHRDDIEIGQGVQCISYDDIMYGVCEGKSIRFEQGKTELATKFPDKFITIYQIYLPKQGKRVWVEREQIALTIRELEVLRAFGRTI